MLESKPRWIPYQISLLIFLVPWYTSSQVYIKLKFLRKNKWHTQVHIYIPYYPTRRARRKKLELTICVSPNSTFMKKESRYLTMTSIKKK